MLFRSVAKCSAYRTNAMHYTSKHHRCDTTALVKSIPETFIRFLCDVTLNRHIFLSPQDIHLLLSTELLMHIL